MIQIGSRWSAIDRTFVVTDVKDNWVFYMNEKTKQEYSCLIEAFVHRFQRTVNDEYRSHI